MSKNQIQRNTKKVSISTKLAIKICEPYMNQVLHACYDLRALSYSLDFNTWCERVNDRLKSNLGKE